MRMRLLAWNCDLARNCDLAWKEILVIQYSRKHSLAHANTSTVLYILRDGT